MLRLFVTWVLRYAAHTYPDIINVLQHKERLQQRDTGLKSS